MELHNLGIYKSLLRNKLRVIWKAMSPLQRHQKSLQIIQKVVSSEEYQVAKKIMIYLATPEEVQTRELIQRSLRSGKQVFSPWTNRKAKEIWAIQIKTLSDLQPGSYGILEPLPVTNRKLNPELLDLVIVPGVGFDRQKIRLGRGGGYFDRFLPQTKQARKIGIAFQEQILKRIPAGRHDIRMDKILTDKEVMA